jgi:hypothetical protein
VIRWLRQFFGARSREEEVAEREEYGDDPDRGADALERSSLSSFAATDAGRVAEGELEELRPPPDPAP